MKSSYHPQRGKVNGPGNRMHEKCSAGQATGEVMNMMNWTQKEASLLKDLKGQEQLCVDKYGKYACQAHDPELKQLFRSIQQTEQQHLQTVTGLLNGQMPQQTGRQSQQTAQAANQQDASFCPTQDLTMQQAMEQDKYLCQDALCTEKEVSGAYNVSIFEFRDPQVRQVLNQLQSAEQQHGEQLYRYMARNGMYQAQ